MNITDKLKELEEARAKAVSLQQAIEADLSKELATLPAQYGFKSIADFVAAVAKAAGKRRGRKPGRPNAAAELPAAPVSGKKKRRKRAVITDATRAEVKKLVAAGKSGAEIAKAVGISAPSVQNIKKALGLVKKSGKAQVAVASATEAKPKAAAKPVAPAKKKRGKRAKATAETKAGVKKT